jgi:hypothetical protein
MLPQFPSRNEMMMWVLYQFWGKNGGKHWIIRPETQNNRAEIKWEAASRVSLSQIEDIYFSFAFSTLAFTNVAEQMFSLWQIFFAPCLC